MDLGWLLASHIWTARCGSFLMPATGALGQLLLVAAIDMAMAKAKPKATHMVTVSVKVAVEASLRITIGAPLGMQRAVHGMSA